MRQLKLILAMILATAALIAWEPGLLLADEAGKPQITLERVEVVSSFPWVDPPGRTPLALGFVFNIQNPGPKNVMLDNLKFAYAFEVNPTYYVEMNVPVSYDRIYFAPNTVSQYRIVNVIDSAVIMGKLAVTQGSKLLELNLKPVDLIKDWYSRIGDFSFGIRVVEGMAVFAVDQADVFVPFEGEFPKK